jgi:transcriptional regulator with XRE-family HTH domain
MPRRIEADATTLKVGERLRQLRLEHNMSLAQLADAAGISKGHLSSVEHGLAAITVETIARLAQALETSSPYLLTFPEEDDRDYIVELLRKMSAQDVAKLKRELTKTVKVATKEAAKVVKTTAKAR